MKVILESEPPAWIFQLKHVQHKTDRTLQKLPPIKKQPYKTNSATPKRKPDRVSKQMHIVRTNKPNQPRKIKWRDSKLSVKVKRTCWAIGKKSSHKHIYPSRTACSPATLSASGLLKPNGHKPGGSTLQQIPLYSFSGQRSLCQTERY